MSCSEYAVALALSPSLAAAVAAPAVALKRCGSFLSVASKAASA
jgi:hypothetical protein